MYFDSFFFCTISCYCITATNYLCVLRSLHMILYLIVDPQYKESLWCNEILCGIREQATAYKYTVKQLHPDSVSNAISDDRYNGQENNRILLLIGTSVSWIQQTIHELSLTFESSLGNVIHPSKTYLPSLTISPDASGAVSLISTLSFDYKRAMHQILTYLNNTGNTRIAFVGVNKSSTADLIKKSCFPQEDAIYYNNGSILHAVESFWADVRKYDAVICANDVVALFLSAYLKKRGIIIPRDLHLVSFGNFYLSQLSAPTISSIELNNVILGREAVRAASYLAKSPSVAVDIRIPCVLHLRQSSGIAGEEAFIKQDGILARSSAIDNNTNFYEDSNVSALMSLENTLLNADITDLQILRGLLQRDPLDKIAEETHYSLSTVKYRIRKMCERYGTSDKNILLNSLQAYVSPEKLLTAEERVL